MSAGAQRAGGNGGGSEGGSGSATPSLASLLDHQLELLRRLGELSRRLEACSEEPDTEMLVRVMAERTTLVAAMTEVDRDLTAARRARGGLGEADMEIARRIAAAAAEVAARDGAFVERLRATAADIAKELSVLTAGNTALGAYAKQWSGPGSVPSLQDREA